MSTEFHWIETNPKELSDNPFQLIGNDWMLITADQGERHNTMTASWGGVGILWNKPVATIYVRPQRYTYEFLEQTDRLTLSFFSEEHRKALAFCGSHSGRNCDKAAECGLTPIKLDGSTAFGEARLVFTCRKLYFSDIDPAHLLDPALDSQNYPEKDYHRMYICEITGTYRKEE